MGNRRYIDIHLLQTVPYANLNRDDLGSPKTVHFGGVDRTRVSSQAWKRAVRLAMEDQLGDPAVRTRRLPRQIADELVAAGWPDELAAYAGQQVVAAAAGGLRLEKNGATSVLLYLPKTAIADFVSLCGQHREALEAGSKTKKGKAVLPTDAVNAVLSRRNGIISLFGRMLAELPSSEVDGSVQVAHAFTTHGSASQVDFFTAVDDLNPAGERGSGHMNSAEFSAGVFYRYASVNVDNLVDNLDGDTDAARDLVAAFLSAFITALPGAKRSSTAPFTIPDLAYVAVRSDRPVSLAAAFEAPVRAHAVYGHSGPSRSRLVDYAGKLYELIGRDGLVHHSHASIEDKPLDDLGERSPSFQTLIAGAVAQAFTAGASQP